MKRIAIILLVFAIALTSAACSGGVMSDFLRENLGDEAADSFDAQMEQSRQQLADAGEELGEQLAEEFNEDLQSMKDEFQDQLAEYIEDLFPTEPDSEEVTAYWESMLGQTPGTIQSDGAYTDYYNSGFSKGQCTWYAYGRFYEEHGIALTFSGDANAKHWLDSCADDRVEVIRDPAAIVPGAIAVDKKTTDSSHPGHVTYVEYVTYDDNGNPVDVYFTESNWDSNGTYNAGVDGIVKKLSYEKFVNRGDHQVLGYIVAK